MSPIVLFLFFGCAVWDLITQPGVEAVTPAVEAQSLSHRTTREVPVPHYSKSRKLIGGIDQMPTEQIPRLCPPRGLFLTLFKLEVLRKEGSQTNSVVSLQILVMIKSKAENNRIYLFNTFNSCNLLGHINECIFQICHF